jgi:membrane protease YdiL (CAAX protease family)
VQFLSNFLPIPKTLPIDDFFRSPADVWMVALFGTFVAPVFEELAFRGFLLPSTASAWDWLRGEQRGLPEDARTDEDPRWSVPALIVSCTLTSIAFARVHADQLAHAWAPLAVLFAVSLVLCGVRLWTQSLAASTFIHATYNGTIFTILFFVTGGFRHLDKIR